MRPEVGVIHQTTLLKDILLPEVSAVGGEHATAHLVSYPWIVVLTQECDLQLDRLARGGLPSREGGEPVAKDKILRSILVCPAFEQDHVLAGTYVLGAPRWGGTEKKILLRSGHERYHVLPPEEPLLVTPLVLDFKLVLGVKPEYLDGLAKSNPEKAIAVLQSPYRERLMQRFLSYFGRVAEPDDD